MKRNNYQEVRNKREGRPEYCKSPLLERGGVGNTKEVSQCSLDVEE